MQKTTKKILIIGVIAIVITGTFVLGGCTHRDSIWHNVVENAFSVDQQQTENPTELAFEEIVRSESELQQLIEKHNLTIDISRYDYDFFTEYALLLIYFWGGAGNDRIQLNDVRVRGATLEVHRIKYAPRSASHDGILAVRTLIEIRQADISDVTELQIIAIERRAR